MKKIKCPKFNKLFETMMAGGANSVFGSGASITNPIFNPPNRVNSNDDVYAPGDARLAKPLQIKDKKKKKQKGKKHKNKNAIWLQRRPFNISM